MSFTVVLPDPTRVQVVGIAITLVPGRDASGRPWTSTSEVQRAPDSGGSPGTWATIADDVPALPPAGAPFVDQRPATTDRWHYRWRHKGPGFGLGNFSASVSALPDLIPKAVLNSAINVGGRVSVYPILRSEPLTDGKYALRASQSDGSTKVSDAHNNQGSMPPLAATDTPFTYASSCVNNSGRGQITWSWSAFTIYRADGSTIAVPASSAGAVPAAPTVGQVAGGALGARNRNWRVALVKDKTMMGISSETAFNPGANQLAKITSPSAVAGYDGWVPLACDAANNAEVQQSSAPPTAPIAFGTDWTEPVGGADINSGTVTQWNDSATTTGARAWNLPASVTRYFYPRWDVANALVGFTDALVAARSPQLAAKQNGDGFIALSSGGLAAATPAVAGAGSGSGGGGPCLDAATRVESRTRGIVGLGSCQVGEELRTDGGGWTRIQYLRTQMQRAWLRVQVATGASLLMTRSHPMVTANGVRVASELTMGDFLIVPAGLAEIVQLTAVLGERTQVDLTCEPKAEFWAGEGAELLLTHNAQINS